MKTKLITLGLAMLLVSTIGFVYAQETILVRDKAYETASAVPLPTVSDNGVVYFEEIKDSKPGPDNFYADLRIDFKQDVPLKDVEKFLQKNHIDHYRIYGSGWSNGYETHLRYGVYVDIDESRLYHYIQKFEKDKLVDSATALVGIGQ